MVMEANGGMGGDTLLEGGLAIASNFFTCTVLCKKLHMCNFFDETVQVDLHKGHFAKWPLHIKMPGASISMKRILRNHDFI